MKNNNLPQPQKRTSLVPTKKKNKLKRTDEIEKYKPNDNFNENNYYDENRLNKNRPADTKNYKVDVYHHQNITEKITIKNTTTKSIETRTPDGHYKNAYQSDESLEEYIKYDTPKKIFEDVVDVYPTFENLDFIEKNNFEELKKIDDKKILDKPINNERLLDDTFQNRKTTNDYIQEVKQDGMNLRHIDEKYRNRMIESLAVKQNPMAIQFVSEQNQVESICLDAVRENGLVIKYIKNPTLSVCIEAIKQNWLAFYMIVDKNYKICFEAVKQNGLLLKYIKDQDEKICKEAVYENPQALEYVLNQSEDIIRCALLKSGLCLQYVKHKTKEMCKLALKQNTLAMKYIPYEILQEGIDLSEYVFIYSKRHILANSIDEIKNLRHIYLKMDENGYLTLNALMHSKYRNNFILEKDEYVDDDFISRIVDNNHLVVLVN